ncbi:hypothetical protein C2E23DRAFT_883375 [Lenzites betulinus]|nr:hypothetical protein C2E23DRAFT_883375 [Lenzites betulinus]
MAPVTRKQIRESLEKEARRMEPKAARFIGTLSSLLAFVDLATVMPSIGAGVEVLTINLIDAPGFPASQLRFALQHMPNVQNLRLRLPLPLPPGLLGGLRFPRLQHLYTNIPHACLVPFLTNHSTIATLHLAVCCRTKACPLENVHLPHLKELWCTAPCIWALPYQSIDRLTITVLDPNVRIQTILRGLSAPTSLKHLTIDVCPDEVDVLQEVSRVAPHVRSLALVEKELPRNTVRRSLDQSMWHAALLGMKPGDEAQELALVLQWGGACMPSEEVHPALNHITLFYGGDHPKSVATTLSFWDKKDGLWARSSTDELNPTLTEA